MVENRELDEFIVLNRYNEKIKFKVDEENCLAFMISPSSYYRVGQNDKQEIQFYDGSGGPMLGLGYDLNAEIYNYDEFLKQDHKKLIKHIKIEKEHIILTYTKEAIKSHINHVKKESEATKQRDKSIKTKISKKS